LTFSAVYYINSQLKLMLYADKDYPVKARPSAGIQTTPSFSSYSQDNVKYNYINKEGKLYGKFNSRHRMLADNVIGLYC